MGLASGRRQSPSSPFNDQPVIDSRVTRGRSAEPLRDSNNRFKFKGMILISLPWITGILKSVIRESRARPKSGDERVILKSGASPGRTAVRTERQPYCCMNFSYLNRDQVVRRASRCPPKEPSDFFWRLHHLQFFSSILASLSCRALGKLIEPLILAAPHHPRTESYASLQSEGRLALCLPHPSSHCPRSRHRRKSQWSP